MQLKRTLIAIVMLFSYTIVFAHNIIPHCPHSAGDDATCGLHAIHSDSHHHEHNHDAGDEDSHIIHADHVDDGIFDFLVCMLSETEHSDNENENHQIVHTENQAVNMEFKLDVQKIAILFVAFDLTPISAEIDRPEGDLEIVIPLPPIEYAPRRGPPVLFS